MENRLNHAGRGRWSRWRIAGWSLPALLLLLPLVAMQFTSEVNWTGSDFVFAGVVFGTIGLAFEFAVRRSGNLAYRLGAAAALLAAFFIIWCNAAVGMIGSEDNGYNFLFLAVIAIALAGAAFTRLRAAGMAQAMLAAGAAQVAVAAGGYGSDPRGAVLSMILASLWLVAAALFHTAARAGAVQGRR